MSTANLIRSSGLICLLAGVLHVLAALLHPVGEDLAAVNSPNWVLAHFLYWASVILLLFGLMGLSARQADKAGRLGLVGFVLAFIGTAIVGVFLFFAATSMPLIAATAPDRFTQLTEPPVFALPVFGITFGLGFVLFGVATMRAGVLPRWSGLLLLIGILLSMAEGSPIERTLLHVIVTIGHVLLGLSLAWMGYALWSEKREPARSDRASLQPELHRHDG